MKLQQAIENIREDIGDSAFYDACVKVVVYVVNYPASKLSYITYGSLRKVVGSTCSDEQLLLGVQYLCGDRAAILLPRFELIDDSETHIIPNEDVSLARKTGILIHPETGEPVEKFEEKLVIFFEPSTQAKEITN